jgi:hypothetical protein
MAVMHGKDAQIEKNSVAISFATDWTIDVTLASEDITDFGDDWRAVVGGIASWSGSFTCFWDPGNTEQKAIHDAIVTAAPTGALADMDFYFDGTNFWDGSILITGMSVTTAVSGVNVATWTFDGNGALSYN